MYKVISIVLRAMNGGSSDAYENEKNIGRNSEENILQKKTSGPEITNSEED